MRRWPDSLVLSLSLLLASCVEQGRTFDLDVTPTDDADTMMPQADLTGTPPRDMAGQKPPDLTGAPPPDMLLGPITGSVGPKGGTVNRLLFGVSGDARPSQCNETFDYPSAILKGVFSRMNAAGVEFVVDTGDHMFVCQNGTQMMADAQMNLYVAGTQNFAKTTFMTLGNHDCVSMTNPSYCGVNGFSTPNYRAFLNANAAVSALPYYSFDVRTNGGLARFIIIADNAWGPAESAWLSTTMADAAKNATYQFVFRHHPLDNVDWGNFPQITQIVKQYKHTILFEGHSHELKLDTYNDPTGHTIIVGNAGAPLATNFTWYGYAIAEQIANGNIMIRYYDQATGNVMGSVLIPM